MEVHFQECYTINTIESENFKESSGQNEDNEQSTSTCENEQDYYWNYKNGEFFIGALICINVSFERQGNGLGLFITNKILLPVFHGLAHSNYSNTIHRFNVRVLCEATPKEGLKLIYDAFNNTRGKEGCNISKDERLEHRIHLIKRLIRYL